MPLNTVPNALWLVTMLDVSWPERPNPSDSSKKQRRRQLSATIETDVDAWSVAVNGAHFSGATPTVTDMIGYIGDGSDNTLSHSVQFAGEWQKTNIHTAFDGGRARISIDLWRFVSTWEDVPEAP